MGQSAEICKARPAGLAAFPAAAHIKSMRQASHRIEIRTQGQGLLEITSQVVDWVGRQGMATGLLTLFCRHTSASLLIQENADPDVRADLEAFFGKLADPGSLSVTAS